MLEAEEAVPRAPHPEIIKPDDRSDMPEDEIAVTHKQVESVPFDPSCGVSVPRRVDFHWIVRDRNYLLWFSDLLNHLSSPSPRASTGSLDVRTTTHVTKNRTSSSTHIFRHLLERHRTEQYRASPLTGLINPTHLGRPDLAQIMDEHYESMRELNAVRDEKGRQQSAKRCRVGGFYCGAPLVSYELSDRYRILTLRGREDRTFIGYHFMMEVF